MSVDTISVESVEQTIRTMRLATAPVTNITSIVIMVLFLITFLYDPDGSAVGANLFGAAPGVLLVIATLVGNLAWLVGALMWLSFGWTVILILNDEVREKTIQTIFQASKKSGIDPLAPFSPSKWMRVVSYISLAIGVFGVASGFWFTAVAWTLLSIALMVYRRKMLTELLTALTGHDHQGETIIHAEVIK